MAELVRSRFFDFKDETYEIRAVAERDRIAVRVYREGKPATPFTYSIESDGQQDLAVVRGADGVKELMNMAQADVFAGRGRDAPGS